MNRFLIFLFLVLPSVVFSQDYNSIVTITSNLPDKQNNAILEAVGTGVVIGKKEDKGDGYLGYVATAYHVVQNGFNIRIKFFNGVESKDAVVLGDAATHILYAESDVAILLAWIPKEVKPVEIGEVLELSDELLLVGKPKVFREYKGKLLKRNKHKIYIDAEVSPGDSGGPIFKDDKLVGIISGGWFWLERTDETLRTWPAHGGGPIVIKKLFSIVK